MRYYLIWTIILLQVGALAILWVPSEAIILRLPARALALILLFSACAVMGLSLYLYSDESLHLYF